MSHMCAYAAPNEEGRCLVVEKLFGMYMYNICIHCIVFKLCIGKKKRSRKKINKIENFTFDFQGICIDNSAAPYGYFRFSQF